METSASCEARSAPSSYSTGVPWKDGDLQWVRVPRGNWVLLLEQRSDLFTKLLDLARTPDAPALAFGRVVDRDHAGLLTDAPHGALADTDTGEASHLNGQMIRGQQYLDLVALEQREHEDLLG